MPGKQNICDDTCRDGSEYVVPVHAYPLIPARRRLQSMPVPVVDDVITIAVLRRKPLALVPIVMRNGAAWPPPRCVVQSRPVTISMRRPVTRVWPVVRRLVSAVVVMV